MKKFLFMVASLLLSQHVFAKDDYLCTINSSRASIIQAVAGSMLPDIETHLHTHSLEGVSSGDSFMASLGDNEETQSAGLDIVINYRVGDSSYKFDERLFREVNIQGSRGFRTKESDQDSKKPLLGSTKTNLMSNRAFGSIKKNVKGFSGNLRLELETDNDNWYSQIIKFDCIPSI